MADKSDITFEAAKLVIDRVTGELGLLVSETSGFLKVQGPTTKHRIYVQKSRNLGRIDTTVPLATDDPAYRALSSPNGSIASHVTPDLTQLERVLRMLADGSLGVQVPNKPRPFAATKAPAARRPKAVAPAVPAEALKEGPTPAAKELADRLAVIKARGREAKINNILENPGRYGEMTYEAAALWLDQKRTLKELEETHRASYAAEGLEAAQEAGLGDAIRDSL